MKNKLAVKLITEALKQLDIQKNSQAWKEIYKEALAASEILGKDAILQLIVDLSEQYSFEECGH